MAADLARPEGADRSRPSLETTKGEAEKERSAPDGKPKPDDTAWALAEVRHVLHHVPGPAGVAVRETADRELARFDWSGIE